MSMSIVEAHVQATKSRMFNLVNLRHSYHCYHHYHYHDHDQREYHCYHHQYLLACGPFEKLKPATLRFQTGVQISK